MQAQPAANEQFEQSHVPGARRGAHIRVGDDRRHKPYVVSLAFKTWKNFSGDLRQSRPKGAVFNAVALDLLTVRFSLNFQETLMAHGRKGFWSRGKYRSPCAKSMFRFSKLYRNGVKNAPSSPDFTKISSTFESKRIRPDMRK